MDMQTPDFATTEETSLSRIFLKRLLQKLASTLPLDAEQDSEGFAEEWDAARELFFAMQPRNPVEAALAARAVACHYRSMDMLSRAAQPGTSDEKALRLSANAIAAGRSFDAALKTLEKRHNKLAPGLSARGPADDTAAKPAPKRTGKAAQPPEPAPAAAPIPHVELFQPRDKYGNPIPPWRYEWMTPAQRRAAYCYPRNPELEAAAIAEEEKMIAEQKAEDAARQAINPDAEPGSS